MDFKNIDEGHPDGEEPLVFYYNREERIKNSPKIVKDFYAGKLIQKRPGLFRALVSTRQNRMVFFCLVAAVIMAFFFGFFGPSKNEASIAGVDCELSAFSFEDNVLVSVKFNEPAKKYKAKYESAVKVKALFSACDADGQKIFEKEINDVYNGKELFIRTTFADYDIFTVAADVEIENESSRLSCKIEKR